MIMDNTLYIAGQPGRASIMHLTLDYRLEPRLKKASPRTARSSTSGEILPLTFFLPFALILHSMSSSKPTRQLSPVNLREGSVDEDYVSALDLEGLIGPGRPLATRTFNQVLRKAVRQRGRLCELLLTEMATNDSPLRVSKEVDLRVIRTMCK